MIIFSQNNIIKNIQNIYYLVFVFKTSNIALMLWVHSRARRMGIGTKLLELLKINYVLKPNNDSKDFWKKCDIQPLKFL